MPQIEKPDDLQLFANHPFFCVCMTIACYDGNKKKVGLCQMVLMTSKTSLQKWSGVFLFPSVSPVFFQIGTVTYQHRLRFRWRGFMYEFLPLIRKARTRCDLTGFHLAARSAQVLSLGRLACWRSSRPGARRLSARFHTLSLSRAPRLCPVAVDITMLTRRKLRLEEMCLFEPYTVEKEYHCPFSYVDLTKEYEKMVENPRIEKKKISARMLEEEISKLQQESDYPYIVNIDTVNVGNPIKGKIVMSNLCSEILQVQEPSVINDEQEYVKLGRDISCNLGSTNIVNLMKAPDFGRSVKTMVKALMEVSDESNIKSVPSVAHGNETAHAIGLGAMGLHSFLAQLCKAVKQLLMRGKSEG